MNFKQIFLYGIFGALTTALDIFVYWLITRVFGIAVVPSTVIAWGVAVLFAYWSNRNFVFQSKENSFTGIIREAAYFFAARIATGITDVVIMYLFVDVLGFYDVIIKTASNILVIVLNYIASKFFIFKGESNS